MKYLGDGSAWVDGIPARDLTSEEWDALTEAERQHAVASGLYEFVPAGALVNPSQPNESQEVD